MKIALAQNNYHIGNFESNVAKIKASNIANNASSGSFGHQFILLINLSPE